MNFQTTKVVSPLRVMLINPLLPASQLTMTKILSGNVFGHDQFIDLILLVYANETGQAEMLAQEYISCAFACFNSIRITSDIPCLSDADVFVFMTSFSNPNSFDFNDMDSTELFDNLYLIIKIAASFAKPLSAKQELQDINPKKKTKEVKEPIKAQRKPIIVADGLIVIDILMILAKRLPPDILFFVTPLRSIAKTTLSDLLKVKCSDLNTVYVWGANDIVFHTEFGVPYLKDDIVNPRDPSDWDAISPEMLEKLNMEHIQFNASWMKKEFIDKMVKSSSANPYGCMCKSAEMAKTLHGIWRTRCSEHAKYFKVSVGVISDGSLGTVKGLPYVLPLIMTGETWSVDTLFEETSHLRHEIRRINAAAREHHQKLVPYCKKFLQDNVIQKTFIATSPYSESESSYSSLATSQSSGRSDDDY
ncbi:hypothetical protein PYW08_015924 [Mythimna loreyi]|uniref:Uncharacterized protein n=1 Tax=Mythimna loreyi TaxID=667449 RepID=A0ACC2QWA8_9NEOP|nr:hypothetical protein PYW08_015924 [Mythimna loreyi]